MENENATWREKLELHVYKKYGITIGADFIVAGILLIAIAVILIIGGVMSFGDKTEQFDSSYHGLYITKDEDFVTYYNSGTYDNNVIVTDNVATVEQDELDYYTTTDFTENTLYLSNIEEEYTLPLDVASFENFVTQLNAMSYSDFIKDTNKDNYLYIFLNTDTVANNSEYLNVIYGNITNNGYEQAKTVFYDGNDNINTMFKDLTVENPPVFLIDFEGDEIKYLVDDLAYSPFESNSISCDDKEELISTTVVDIESMLSEQFQFNTPVDNYAYPTALCDEQSYTPEEWAELQAKTDTVVEND